MRFEVRAIGAEGVVFLALEAANRDDARSQAAGQGYTVLGVRRKSGVAWRRDRFPLLLFTQELLALLNAGLGLVEALEALQQKHQAEHTRKTLDAVLAQIYEGKSFAVALESCAGDFPRLYIETVRASEKTGGLPEALARFVGYQAQLNLVRSTFVSASIYPALLIAVGGLVTLFLLGYVVPRFSAIYTDLGRDMPFASRLLLQVGQIIDRHALAVLGVLVAGVVTAVFALRQAEVRQRLVRLIWRVPAIGERMRIYQLARFYRTAGMLLRGGVTFTAAGQMVMGLLDIGLRDSLAGALREVREGKPISDSMERHRLTTPIALRMLQVGERSGDMGGMMERVANFYDEDLARWVEWFTRLFEPLLMIVIGLVIGLVVLLMYMPIFELAGSLQ